MPRSSNDSLLKLALIFFGVLMMCLYPLGLIWPTGWIWHGGQGAYYFQMMCGIYFTLGAYLIAASRDPAQHRSLISFTITSSVVHAAIMTVQAMGDGHEHGHLLGDVPALLLIAAVLWYLMPRATVARDKVQAV
jgi:hypothetical protein